MSLGIDIKKWDHTVIKRGFIFLLFVSSVYAVFHKRWTSSLLPTMVVSSLCDTGLTCMIWYSTVLICLLLIIVTSNDEHYFTCLLAVCISTCRTFLSPPPIFVGVFFGGVVVQSFEVCVSVCVCACARACKYFFLMVSFWYSLFLLPVKSFLFYTVSFVIFVCVVKLLKYLREPLETLYFMNLFNSLWITNYAWCEGAFYLVILHVTIHFFQHRFLMTRLFLFQIMYPALWSQINCP